MNASPILMQIGEKFQLNLAVKSLVGDISPSILDGRGRSHLDLQAMRETRDGRVEGCVDGDQSDRHG